MKAVLILLLATVVMGSPTEKNPPESTESSIVQTITKIANRVKDMRNIASGNHTDSIYSNEITKGINAATSNVTYEDLIEKVDMVKKKIKELQAILSRTLNEHDKKYSRPSEVETF